MFIYSCQYTVCIQNAEKNTFGEKKSADRWEKSTFGENKSADSSAGNAVQQPVFHCPIIQFKVFSVEIYFLGGN